MIYETVGVVWTIWIMAGIKVNQFLVTIFSSTIVKSEKLFSFLISFVVTAQLEHKQPEIDRFYDRKWCTINTFIENGAKLEIKITRLWFENWIK